MQFTRLLARTDIDKRNIESSKWGAEEEYGPAGLVMPTIRLLRAHLEDKGLEGAVENEVDVFLFTELEIIHALATDPFVNLHLERVRSTHHDIDRCRDGTCAVAVSLR